MNGKAKVVAAVAASAVALTIGAGAARCSMDAPDAQNGHQAPQEQASGKQDDAKTSQSSQQAPDERQPSESELGYRQKSVSVSDIQPQFRTRITTF